MEVVFLGFQDLNFDSRDGNHIEGVKFFYYFKSNNPFYHGLEVGSIFVAAARPDLVAAVRQAPVGRPVVLNMAYNGRRAVFNGFAPVKSAS